jgi:hypothetical protein
MMNNTENDPAVGCPLERRVMRFLQENNNENVD